MAEIAYIALETIVYLVIGLVIMMIGYLIIDLIIPVDFPKLNSDLLNKDPAPSFRDIAFNMAKPPTTKLPDKTMSPFFFIKASLSPVKFDSLT